MHLLFPLFSSIVFVLGMMLVKRGSSRGVRPWTGTFLGNAWLGLLWSLPALLRQQVVPVEVWPQAGLIGVLFLLGQLFAFLAFQYGDVSVATPIFGVKVLMVAVLAALMSGEPVPSCIWLAATLATAGVVLVQSMTRSRGGTAHPERRGLTVLLVMLSAGSLSLFDVLLQKWGRQWNSREFLPIVFAATGLLSLVFVPWCDNPKRLRELGVLPWVLAGTFLIAVQAVSMSFVLSTFGDATRVNIVYALRGLWGVILAWMLATRFQSHEATLPNRVMLIRLTGAGLLMASVVIAMIS